jgi:hypothetical protein
LRELAAAAAVVALVTLAPAAQQRVAARATPDRQLERGFAPNGRVVMHLSAGDYDIEGSSEPRIRLQWDTRDPDDADEVEASATVSGNEAVVKTSGPSNGFHVTIQVPKRSDLIIRLSAGDLEVNRVQGHKDISAWAGNLKIGIANAADYRNVKASVTAGDLRAEPFNVSKGGLFRSFNWEGKGGYDLRARLTAGDLVLRAESAAP